MNAAARTTSPATMGLVRAQVKELLERNENFRKLPTEAQQKIAHDTVEIASYLAEPEGIRADTLARAQAARPARGRYASPQEEATDALSPEGIPRPQFQAQAAREGAAVAGALLREVNFPTFVASLITGVFNAIVQASMQQMEAYGRLVADVAKSLNQFRDENVSVNQGRDYLTESYPDLFSLEVDTGEEGGPAPRVRLRDGVDERAALARVNELPVAGGPLTRLDDDSVEEKLVPAARTQLATSRQQLLATMVLMGINRIVVSDGRISAKVLYDFQARDNYKYQQSATQFDYGKQYAYAGEGATETEYEGGARKRSSDTERDEESVRDASWYTKGEYKYSAQPVLKLATAYQEAGEGTLSTRAQLAGVVDINFKSDYLPLEKMADSFQINRIQQAARPGQVQAGAGAPATTAPASGAAPTPAPQAGA